jgi:hypothetical protein
MEFLLRERADKEGVTVGDFESYRLTVSVNTGENVIKSVGVLAYSAPRNIFFCVCLFLFFFLFTDEAVTAVFVFSKSIRRTATKWARKPVTF